MRRRRGSRRHRSACSSPPDRPRSRRRSCPRAARWGDAPRWRGWPPSTSRAPPAAMAAIPLAHTFAGLLALNGLIGIVGAVVPAALSARLAAVTTPAQSVVAMGAHNAAADVGFFVGPVIGGIVADYGLAWPFVITLPIAAGATGLIRTAPRPGAFPSPHP